jgi:hypothetical protein
LRARALRRASPSEIAEDRSQSGIAASGHSREAQAPLIHVKTLGNHLMVPHVTHETHARKKRPRIMQDV